MKVIISWQETWSREAEYEIDEVEFDAWRGEHPVTSRLLKEFVLSGIDTPGPEELAPGVNPGGPLADKSDAYYNHEISSVRRKP